METIKNSDKPAYPTLIQESDPRCWSTYNGLTKREEFAKAAMQSVIKLKNVGTYDLARNNEDVCGDIATASIRIADELLKQLEKK